MEVMKMDIGERIRYVRQFRGLTQEELAIKVGLGEGENGRTRISQYENGKRKPKEDMLEKISKALNVKSLYLSTKERTAALDFAFSLFEWDVDNLPINIINEDEKYLIHIDNPIFEDFLKQWAEKQKDLADGKITKEEYINWKINYGAPREI